MPTEYTVRLDRERCDGVFACLARDERFVEAADGLATMVDAADGLATMTDAADGEGQGDVVATFADDRREDAEQAAAACPLDAIDVTDGGEETEGGRE